MASTNPNVHMVLTNPTVVVPTVYVILTNPTVHMVLINPTIVVPTVHMVLTNPTAHTWLRPTLLYTWF